MYFDLYMHNTLMKSQGLSQDKFHFIDVYHMNKSIYPTDTVIKNMILFSVGALYHTVSYSFVPNVIVPYRLLVCFVCLFVCLFVCFLVTPINQFLIIHCRTYPTIRYGIIRNDTIRYKPIWHGML